LEEIRGLLRQARQDGFLKSREGSSLGNVGVDLKKFKDLLGGAKGRLEDTKGELEEVRGKMGEIKGTSSLNAPLDILYPPLSTLKGTDLTFEMMIELVNKTDYLLRQLVDSLEQHIGKEDAAGSMEKWRWGIMGRRKQKEDEFDKELEEIKGAVREVKGKVGDNRGGQSLVEVVIGLAIGAILMGTAAFAVTIMLRTNLTSEKSQFASRFAQSLSDNIRSFAGGNWDAIYGLTKATSSHYFLNASGTTFFVVQGEEGMLDGEVVSGLVGHWKFDEVETSTSTTTYDATGNNYNGTLSGGTVRASSTCKIANCMYFDGVDDQISLGSGTQYDSASFSVAMWIRPVQLNGTTANNNIFLGRENYLNSGFRAGIAGSNAWGRVELWTTQSGGTLSLNSDSVRLSTSTESFYHVVVTYSSSTSIGSMYVGGASVATSSGSYVVPTGRTLAVDGGIGGVTFLNAYIDDVRWYNRALSADEVRQLYNSAIYERFFTVENVCRTNDASSTIASTAPCSGTVEDISTQWVTSFTQWVTGGATSEVKIPTVITRSRNAVFRQTDWSGGATDEGAVTQPTGKFASSTNASTTGGKIQIQNLSQQ